MGASVAWNELIRGALIGAFSRNAGSVSADLLSDGEEMWWGNTLSGMFGGSPAAGIEFSHEQAMSVSAVYACSRARSEIMASLPAMVYLEVGNNARQRHSTNDLWRMLHDQPNRDMDSMIFYEIMQMRSVNRGNGFAIIERDNRDVPIALWPVHNSRLEPFRDRSGELMWRLYMDTYDEAIERYQYKLIPDRNMLNIRGYGSNGYIGRGVIPVAVEEISLNMAMTRYGAKYFKQGGRPIGVVEHPGFIDDPSDRREYRKDINTLHSGVENWHKIATLWHGAKFKELQFSPEQSQFVSGRNFSSKQICTFYNVPPAVVQIFEDYKFATVDAMIQQFVMTCVRSDAIRFERGINNKVIHTTDSNGRMVDLFDDPFVFEFVIEALLRGDSKKQAEVLEIERRNGVTNANEWRALSNRVPLPGEQGERYVLPGGFEDLATLGQRDNAGSGSEGEGSSRASQSAFSGDPVPAAGSPSFDREFVAKSLESGVPRHMNRSRGGSSAEATTVQDELDTVAVNVLTEAIGRVESVLASELKRAGDDQMKQAKAWGKHGARVSVAVLPACEIYCRHRDKDPEQVANAIAEHLVETGVEQCSVSIALFEEE